MAPAASPGVTQNGAFYQRQPQARTPAPPSDASHAGVRAATDASRCRNSVGSDAAPRASASCTMRSARDCAANACSNAVAAPGTSSACRISSSRVRSAVSRETRNADAPTSAVAVGTASWSLSSGNATSRSPGRRRRSRLARKHDAAFSCHRSRTRYALATLRQSVLRRSSTCVSSAWRD